MQSVWKVWNAIFNSAGKTNQALQARNVIVFQDYLSRVCENRRVLPPCWMSSSRLSKCSGTEESNCYKWRWNLFIIFPLCAVICQVLHFILHKQWMQAGRLAYKDNVVIFAVVSSCSNDVFLSQYDAPKRKYCYVSLSSMLPILQTPEVKHK